VLSLVPEFASRMAVVRVVWCAALVLVASLAACATMSIETRTLSPLPAPSQGVSLILNQRIVSNGRIVLSSRAVTQY